MRPGQTAPEFQAEAEAGTETGLRFNEAGADCPGIRIDPAPVCKGPDGFNEAGADCPGIRISHAPDRRT